MSDYEIRSGGFADLDVRTAYLLWQLRVDVFVVEQDCAYRELDGRDLEPTARHLWCEVDGAVAGYLRVLDDGDELRIGRVVVAPSHRGRGLSGALMRAALAAVGDRPSVLSAQEPLEAWYASFGYARTGETYDDDGIPHVPMRRP